MRSTELIANIICQYSHLMLLEVASSNVRSQNMKLAIINGAFFTIYLIQKFSIYLRISYVLYTYKPSGATLT